MKIDLSQFKDLYLQESSEHIASMETGLLELRSSPNNLDLMNAVFRSAHSIKGGAGSFGLTQLVRYTHTLENLLDRMRSAELTASPAVIDALLTSVDILSGMLTLDAEAPMPERAAAMLRSLEQYSLTPASVETADAPSRTTTPAPASKLYNITFKPSRNILDTGCNPLLLLRNLVALGTLHASTMDTSALPSLAELETNAFFLSWTIELETCAPVEDLREVFEFVEHVAEISITVATQITLPAPETPTPEAATPEAATPEAPAAAWTGPDRRSNSASAEVSIRVPIGKVDRLIDLVGELVIAQAMTEQMIHNFEPHMLPRITESIAALERNTRELHERVMSIRMLNIGSLFRRYTRTVYDICKSTGKQATLEFAGEETEIDKSMLELLADPMVHLIRNAVDHGIEAPEVRTASGKPAQGTVWLRAFHRSGKVVIEIEDDGAGIDTVRVRQKAVERGLIAPGAQLTDAQIRMLIFEPGFSTKDEVSDLSGRGVGMDVVKRNIQQISGAVLLESTVGKGSCITIELPLTLAILEGLIVRVQQRKLVLPLLSIVETISCERRKFVRIIDHREVFLLRGEPVPLLHLAHFLELPFLHEPPAQALIVIVEAGSGKMGLVIDEVLGQQQVVLKSLEKHLRRIDGLMGATILGDGLVAPILDVNALRGLRATIPDAHPSIDAAQPAIAA